MEMKTHVPITKFRHATREEKFAPSLRAIDSLHVPIQQKRVDKPSDCYPNPSA